MSFGRTSGSRATLPRWAQTALAVGMVALSMALGCVLGVLISCATHHVCPK